MLAQLSPGVQYTLSTASRSNRLFDNGGMDNFQISGGRGFTNDFLLDGVPNTGTETTQPNNLSFVAAAPVVTAKEMTAKTACPEKGVIGLVVS